MTYELLVALIGICCLVVLIAARVAVAYAMILVGGVGVSVLEEPSAMASQLQDLAYLQFSVFELTLFPMFVFMGNLAVQTGLAERLFRASHVWIGHARGGIAMSVLLACASFSAICGSARATTAVIGKVALPELRRFRYGDKLATGTVAAGGLLGTLIPPSIVLVVYSVLVNADITMMFKAALVPGLMALALFVISVAVFVRVCPEAAPAHRHTKDEDLLGALLGAIPVLVIFGVVIGGMSFGVFEPTPAAALGVLLVAAYGMAVRKLSFAGLKQSLLNTARNTGLIYLILFGAEMLRIFMERGGVPGALSAQMLGMDVEPLAVVILFLVALIALGCVMDSLSVLLLAVPFFWPVVASLDLGMPEESVKVWFGILALIVLEVGLLTPPIGLGAFAVAALAKNVEVKTVYAGVVPFLAAEAVRVVLLIAFPALALWLPSVIDS